MSLSSLLPAPIHQPLPSDIQPSPPIKKETQEHALATSKKSEIPPYGQRRGWRPKDQEDFGDGGSYPECHVAQYPLNLGRKAHSNAGNMLSLQVDADGKVKYDAIAKQGHAEGRVVQTSFKDLVPLAKRMDVTDKTMARPSEEEVQATAERTRKALEKLVDVKIKAAQPKNVPASVGATQYIRYTPGDPSSAGGKQRIIKMTEVVEDPLEPPRFKHKKIPRGPPSPPAPILRSPPRKVTAQEQKDWIIPPCVSNWKNNKGYTIPLDKRLAADGRGLQDVHINDRFAQFSESLYIADRHAREEVRQRALMQQRIAQKEKEQKEEHLRLLAQRAREERSGAAPRIVEKPSAAMGALAGYGSDSEGDGEGDEGDEEKEEERGEYDNSADEREARERDELRRERRRDREREMRMSNMGTERRARVLAKAQNRDISEKIALGLAKPTLSKESMMDSRLFNREQYSNSFGDDDAFNLYDKALFTGSNAGAAIYKPRGNVNEDGEAIGGGGEEGVDRAMKIDRFNLGVAGEGKGFEGADASEVKEGPVQFEAADPFGVDKFYDEARKGGERKRGLESREEREESQKKRMRED